ncbi:unnamed protein product [Litomosoides sigmodontis]|uniref:Uncharacterized protein n=1 Tax=Litomosoides sigmodontis TaxID=42156 RepID=A0A3P6S5Q3_LITSI|nr:unnamed protein product [Litomosoides sigmodontis]
MKTGEDRKIIPAYRIAILGVCQLQFKICSKLIERTTPSCPALFGLTTFEPSTLKRLAGRFILLHLCNSPCDDLGGILCRKFEIRDEIGATESDNKLSCYHQIFPTELIKFLEDGATDYD